MHPSSFEPTPTNLPSLLVVKLIEVGTPLVPEEGVDLAVDSDAADSDVSMTGDGPRAGPFALSHTES